MLTAHQIIEGYLQGVFPMAEPDDDNTIYWYQPTKRGVILPEEFHVPKNLKKEYQKQAFELKIDCDFTATIKACSEREETWISDEIMDAYIGLHQMGFAHSFEAWQNKQLVGGLYGVRIGKIFFGESMFHRVTNASKIVLVYLMEWVAKENIQLVDCQFITDHLKQFGAKEIPQKQYLTLLKKAIAQ
ncbi:MAG: leucyl/phenylalanyl-tRNA--protein transferase [Bacteroidota bacterium]|nr:leucyl/phenylalanyl-tRNA--protein transferase [Bacteroidota bacterium]